MALADQIEKVDEALRADDDASFEAALQGLGGLPSSVDAVRGLLGLLREEEDLHHHMFAIIHAVERLDPRHIYEGVVRELPTMHARAREWCDIVISRLLASRREDGRGFDHRDFVATLVASGPKSTQESFARIIERIEREPGLSAELRQGVREANERLAGAANAARAPSGVLKRFEPR